MKKTIRACWKCSGTGLIVVKTGKKWEENAWDICDECNGKGKMSNLDEYHFSWGEYDKAIHILFKKLKRINYVPDVIIGTSRGGLISAVHLGHLFDGIPELGAIYVRRHLDDCHFSELIKPKIAMRMLPKLKGKIVLITEDTIGTGKTNNCVVNFVKKMKPKKVMTTTISFQKGVKIKNCIYYKLNKGPWQVFPWER
jgi:hypothetical protein